MFSRLKNSNNGILLAFISTFIFSVMGVFTKLVSKTISPTEIVFFRSAITLIIIVFYMRRKGLSLLSGNKKVLAFRGLVGSIGLLFSFYAIANLKLSESSILFQTTPLFVVIFARMFLKEKLPKTFYVLMALSIIGVLLVIKPNLNGFGSFYAMSALLAAVFAAIAYVCIKSLRKDHGTDIIILYYSFTAMIVAFPLMLDGFVFPNLYETIFILIIGLTATIGQVYMTKAFGMEKVGIVSMVSYTGILFNIFWDLVIWGVILDYISLLGGMLILLSSVLLTLKTKEQL